MPARPTITVKRPGRSADTISITPTPIEPTAIPLIDPESTDALAFSMRGRGTMAPDVGEGRERNALAQAELPRGDSGARALTASPPSEQTGRGQANMIAAQPPTRDYGSPDLISIKLPPDVGRQLAAIADRRGSKRTLVAIEALAEPLRMLAAAHRAGGYPELPTVVTGSVRSSIAFALPPDLAADLDFVLVTRRAVRAQVITRLLAPAVRAIYDAEVGTPEPLSR